MSDLVENGARSPLASDSDPASSLRAAALLTLKSKRRKPVVDTSGASGLSQRPPPADTSVQLDYGQDDIASSPTDVAMPPAQLKRDPEDGQLREEGEISDSEDAPSKTGSKRSLDTPTVVKVESPTHNLLDRIRDPPHPGPSTPVPPRECIIDADHVRPGLSMNQDQYDTAKDIVLDLLGWGVPPDYLVDCNLSREIVFYVFSELNLRLPHNLDITGLIPYTPAHVALYSRPLSATPSSRPEAPPSSRPLHGHPSLPPKPLAGSNAVSGPQQRSTVPPPSPPHTSSLPIAPSPTNQHSSASSSLHDMERQRRQELLARKAVQASRKIKPPSDASSIASSSHAPDPADQSGVQDQDVEMTPAVATEAVDDFLKSIGEKSVTPEASMQPEPPEPANSMDVDEIPGLGGSYRNAGSASSFYGTVPDSQMPAYTDQVVISPAESSFSAAPPHPVPQSDPPPFSGESGSTTSPLEQNSYDTEQLSHHHQGLQRRGSKRPTAADFVDFDPGSRNGYNNGSMPHPLKRKTASFASVSGQRKLVIDLSDSEGEAEDYVMHDGPDWENGSGYSSPAPGRTPLTGGRATPPASMTPAALVEKEQEIRKMRELIAQREMSRKQKAMSRTNTTITVESPQREEEGSGVNGSNIAPPQPNGFHPDGTTPTAVSDKRVLTDAAVAGSASTSSSATPPIDSEDLGDQNGVSSSSTNGVQDSATADTASQDQPVNVNGLSSQEARQEPLVDVDPASSSSVVPRSPTSTTPVPQRPEGSRPTSPVPPPQEGSSSSKYEYYAAYDSPFESYPLLRLRSQQIGDPASEGPSSTKFTQASSSHSPTTTCSTHSSLSSSSTSSSASSSSISSLASFSSSLSFSSTYNSLFPLPNLKPLKLATCSALDPAKRICQYEVPGGGVCRDAGCEDVHLNRVGREGVAGVVEPSDADTAEYLHNMLPSAWVTKHDASIPRIAAALQEARIKNATLVFEERVARALAALGPPPPPGPGS